MLSASVCVARGGGSTTVGFMIWCCHLCWATRLTSAQLPLPSQHSPLELARSDVDENRGVSHMAVRAEGIRPTCKKHRKFKVKILPCHLRCKVLNGHFPSVAGKAAVFSSCTIRTEAVVRSNERKEINKTCNNMSLPIAPSHLHRFAEKAQLDWRLHFKYLFNKMKRIQKKYGFGVCWGWQCRCCYRWDVRMIFTFFVWNQFNPDNRIHSGAKSVCAIRLKEGNEFFCCISGCSVSAHHHMFL